MKVVILAGGLGTRLAEETDIKPKPMVEIGGRPILWHIMKIYASYGHTEFMICLGYKAHVIKEYFANYFLHMSDVTFDISNNDIRIHQRKAEPWKVTLIDTGENTMTGGRLLRVRPYLDEDDFCFTYGDGVFRTFLLRDGHVPHWQRHYCKLAADCTTLNLVCPQQDLLEADIAQIRARQRDEFGHRLRRHRRSRRSRHPDRRVDRVPTTDPVPEAEHVGGVDTEGSHCGGVGADGHEMA